MRILEENEINYNIDDILDAIMDELGFSAVNLSDKAYYINITNNHRLIINFEGNITIELKLTETTIDLSENTSEVESLVTACESAIEITNIVKRMTGEERSTE